MRKPEQRLWDRFSSNCSSRGLWLQRVENGLVDGMPDVLSISKFTGKVCWIELKYAIEPARPTTPLLTDARGLSIEQRNWHLNWCKHSGTSYLLVGTEKRTLLIRGEYADVVNSMPVCDLIELACAHDWQGIKQELLR